jgi:hypothetical protein
MVIYHHSMVMLLLHVIKHNFHGYYCTMAVNCQNIFITLVPNFNLIISWKFTVAFLNLGRIGITVNHSGIFITLIPGAGVIKIPC